MNSKYGQKTNLRRTTSLAASVAATLLIAGQGYAQVPVDDNGNPLTNDYEPLDSSGLIENPAIESGVALSPAALETLIGPIALYPDDLLAIILPASTYPLEIVQAARFAEAVKSDATLKPDPEWDDSIVALLNYPDVLAMMNNDIDWTWKLGEAVVDQQSDLIAAIESFRDRAYAAGNLKSDEYQTVSVDDGIIEIEPVSEEEIYVPYYEPAEVVRYSARPVYHYYPEPYPVYFYPYAQHYRFGQRPFWGVTTAFTIGWASDRLHVYHHSYDGHPYFGRTYFGSYWRRPSINVYNNYYVNRQRLHPRNRYRVGDYWRPRHRSGPRPRYYSQRNNYRASNRQANRLNNRTTRRNGNQTINRSDNRLNNRAANRAGNRGVNPAANRRRSDNNSIRFRPRGDGAYSATRERRIQGGDRERTTNRTNTARRTASANRIATQRTNRAAKIERANQGRTSSALRQRSTVDRSRAGQDNKARRNQQRRSVTVAPNRNRAATVNRNSRRVESTRRNGAAAQARVPAARTTAPRQSRAASPNRGSANAARQNRQRAAGTPRKPSAQRNPSRKAGAGDRSNRGNQGSRQKRKRN